MEKAITNHKRLTYQIAWSEEDNEYLGTCIEYPGLSHLEKSQTNCFRGIQKLVKDVISNQSKDDNTEL